MMECDVGNVLDVLCSRFPECVPYLRDLQSKQIWNYQDRQKMLNVLARLLITANLTIAVAKSFRAILLDLIHRAVEYVESATENRKQLFTAFSCLVGLSTDADQFILSYLRSNSKSLISSFLGEQEDAGAEPVKKRAKKSKKSTSPINAREVLEPLYRILKHFGSSLLGDWVLAALKFIEDKDDTCRWFAVHIVCSALQMSVEQRQEWISSIFSSEQQAEFRLRYHLADSVEAGWKACSDLEVVSIKTSEPSQAGDLRSHTMKKLLDTDLSSSVVCIGGVLLSSIDNQDATPAAELLVPVDSTTRNLRRMAMAVASGWPVLLEGIVGCGKTGLVEHLAHLTGRGSNGGRRLVKIQLGDEPDSKVLVGTYCCTDVPGQFVWKPGSLLTSVVNGDWILLEDIDCAPMDVLSVLVPLLESRTLIIPGRGDKVKASPDFRIFATQRLVSAGNGLHRRQNSNISVMEKLWMRITVESLARDELKQIIITRHPNLSAVAGRLLDVYSLKSAGKLDESSDESLDDDLCEKTANLVLRDGRLLSPRDLLKWTRRIALNYSSSNVEAVLSEAIDCFCVAIPNLQARIEFAELICARIGVAKSKAQHLCCYHKPTVSSTLDMLTIGRAALRKILQEKLTIKRKSGSSFAFTQPAASLLERIAVCVGSEEPVLLVGETGTGKTSAVQYLADQIGHQLRVVNMNQQSDTMDLLGGYKPVDLKLVIRPLKESFEELLCKTFSRKKNTTFLGHIQSCFKQERWAEFFKLIQHCCVAATDKIEKSANKTEDISDATNSDEELLTEWKKLITRQMEMEKIVSQTKNALAFTFIEGVLVTALKKGEWILLDEINLAPAETLECLSGLLDSASGSIVLTERGDTEPIVRHPDFRLFACMNPATDVGKKDLPLGIRNRFTELYIDELTEVPDLIILVKEYLNGLVDTSIVEGIVNFYLAVRSKATTQLVDGTGHRPHYSLRTLCRALRLIIKQKATTNVPRAVYEAFCMSFLTQLSRSSHPVVQDLIGQHILSKRNLKSVISQPLDRPTTGSYIQVQGYWIPLGTLEVEQPNNYILTPSVCANLKDIARIVAAGSHPVLLQGETSVGKTSLITYLAKLSGMKCHRINNHEHTDLQEYIGCYAADEAGKLVFREGVLVEAMRKGHWIILDELNLAPTDVLEALNRVLDDNRELFISETQEVVKAHQRFMLFATQNPPGLYGGRKVLSRAFRNRFVELHFDEIPSNELETILHKRCALPPSHCKKLVAIMLDLQSRRRSSGLFAGKQGYITLRDLFRWAERYRLASCEESSSKFFDWDQLLADNGFMLLAGRVRQQEEEQQIRESDFFALINSPSSEVLLVNDGGTLEIELVQEFVGGQDECMLYSLYMRKMVIEKHMKRKIDPQSLFSLNDKTSSTTKEILQKILTTGLDESFKHVVWTSNMRRMAVLLSQAVRFKEPLLLVGGTGCGKTTVCQVYSKQHGSQLHYINCHMHTEASDFLGGLRPIRHRSSDADEKESQAFFEWSDGVLVKSMREGSILLIDEISLADDSVLERLNSVLEPERTLLLAEKGGGTREESVEVIANQHFRIVATMNPGGDFGKKELSPALRNRFTEIWCLSTHDTSDLISIVEHNISSSIVPSVESQKFFESSDHGSGFGNMMMEFIAWFRNQEFGRKVSVTIRDILSWVNFINETTKKCSDKDLDPSVAYIHGACLVFIDSIGSESSSSSRCSRNIKSARDECFSFILNQLYARTGSRLDLESIGLDSSSYRMNAEERIVCSSQKFGIQPFLIDKGTDFVAVPVRFALNAPTTFQNALRLVRGLQLPRPILLEGSPGVGKTSLVTALARASGHQLVRINLSEQTDITDLFGADLPVEGGKGGEFAWRDGPLLSALKNGHWIVLDEMNLASQSVLEGLNSCLDHRGEIFVPELGMTFKVKHQTTRLFACQNPLHEGGGRKGLPKSFLNRFTQVYVDALSQDDLRHILSTIYPQLSPSMISMMTNFNQQMYEETVVSRRWGQKGGPWELNLRDLYRWCDLMLAYQNNDHYEPGDVFDLIYVQRLRTTSDRKNAVATFEQVFSRSPNRGKMQLLITRSCIRIGKVSLRRRNGCDLLDGNENNTKLRILHHSLEPLKSLMMCINMNWLAILIGNSGTGKTSLVKALAELTGNVLHVLPMNSSMDTTEILGGFEQADVNRHLVKYYEDVVSCARAVTRSWFLKHSKLSDELRHLLSGLQICDEIFSDNSKIGERRSAVDQNAIHCNKVSALLDVLNTVRAVGEKLGLDESAKIVLDKKITFASSSLSELSRKLESGDSFEGNGRFVWVDSVLVKCLTEGHWLLMENVNFCSPAVLDRLNALMEPNGSLTVSERGVIDGKVPTIVPHPDFRLIFTMDSRRGEISRAMRNRGVEIFILDESSDSDLVQGYDRHDTHTLIADRGVTDLVLSSILYDTSRDLTQGGVASLDSLLHCSSLVAQKLSQGDESLSSLQTSLLESYGLSHRNKKLLSAVMEKVNNAVCQTEENGVGLRWVGPACPLISDWCCDVGVASVQRCTVLFVHLLNKVTAMLKSERLQEQENSKILSEVTFDVEVSVRLLIEQCPVESAALLLLYMKHLLEMTCVSSNETNSCKVLVQKFGDMLYGLEGIINHNLIAVLKSESSRIYLDDSGNRSLGLQLPFDWRWNFEFTSLQSPSVIVISQLSNQFYIIHLLKTLESEVNRIISHYENDHIFVSRKNLHKVSLLYLSVSLNTDFLKFDETLRAAVQHLSRFFSLVIQDVLNCLQENRNVGDTLYELVVTRIIWFKKFLCVCIEPLQSFKTELLCSMISMHWNWLHEKFIICLLDNGFRFSVELTDIISALQATLGQDNEAFRAQLVIVSRYGSVSPFKSEQEAKTILQIESLMKNFDVHSTEVDDTVIVPRIKLRLKSESCNILYSVTNFLHKYQSQDPVTEDEVAEIISSLENIVDKMEPEPMEAGSSSVEPTANSFLLSHTSAASLWPLFELLALRQASILVAQGGTMEEKSGAFSCWAEEVNHFVSFCSQHTAKTSKELKWFSSNCLTKCKNFSRLATVGLVREIEDVGNRSRKLLKLLNTSHFEQYKPSENRGCDSIFSWRLSSTVSDLLLVDGSSDLDCDNAQVQLTNGVSLSECFEKLDQIKSVRNTIWSHSAHINSSEWDLRYQSLRHLQSDLSCFLFSISSLFPESVQSYFAHPNQNLFSLEDVDRLIESLERSQSSGRLCSLVPNWVTDLKSLLRRYQNCWAALERKEDSNKVDVNYWNTLCSLGLVYASVGMLQAQLLAPQGPVDPNSRLEVKLKYMQTEKLNVERELSVREWNEEIQSGEKLSVDHAVVQTLVRQAERLNVWINENSSRVAYRDDPAKFVILLKEVRLFMASFASSHKLSALLNKVESVMLSQDYYEIATVVQEVKICSESSRSFAERLERGYQHYRDLLSGYCAALHKLSYGFYLIGLSAEVQLNRLSLSRTIGLSNWSIEDFLTSLVCSLGPSKLHPSSLDLLQNITSIGFLDVLTKLDRYSTVSIVSRKGRSYLSRAMSSSLVQIFNHVTISQSLTSHSFTILNDLLKKYSDMWRSAEGKREERERENENLYRYKTIGETLTQDQKEEIEIKKMFPEFRADFKDLTGGSTLEDNEVSDEIVCDTADEDSLVPRDIDLLRYIHYLTVSQFSQYAWYKSDTNSLRHRIDLRKPLLQNHAILTDLLKSLSGLLDPHYEQEVIGSHLLACNGLIEVISEDHQVANKPYDGTPLLPPYDIYHDSNVSEVVRCRHVLEKFLDRVNELLKEWPDHPTLLELKTIVLRIMSFPVASSLIRFVKGLEMILHKAQEWEKNAARHVTLSVQLEPITALIIDWRKKELGFWKCCLEMVEVSVCEAASRWWFHIYGLVESFFTPDKSSSNTIAELLTALQMFMEGSSVGEFKTRLDMLLLFHLHVLHVNKSASSQSFQVASVFWNVYQYYKIFSADVDAHINKSREPIEKMLKDYVKIARWNDANFYAVKEAVDKAHKTLHKHMKSYREVLSNTTKSILTDTEAEQITAASKDNETNLGSQTVIDSSHFILSVPVSITGVLSKRLKLMSKFCQQIIDKSTYPKMVEAVNEFSGEILEGTRELQSLSVDHIADKARQKTEVKHISQRKRKALADLFKYLKDISLSYRKGESLLQTSGESRLIECFTQPPCDVSVGLTQLPSLRCDDYLSESWVGCEKYFLRSISRRAALLTSLDNPSKELGMQILERCRGYSEHLMMEVCHQRKDVVKYFNDFLELRTELRCIHELLEEDSLPLPQVEAKIFVESVRTLSSETLACVMNLKMLMGCVTKVSDAKLISPLLRAKLPSIALVNQSDELWTNIMGRLEKHEKDLFEIQGLVIDKTSDKTVVNRKALLDVSKGFEILRSISADFQTINREFSLKEEINPLLNSALFMSEKIDQSALQYQAFLEKVSAQSGILLEEVDNVMEKVATLKKISERLGEKCLKVVENFIKKNEKSATEGQQVDEESNGNETTELENILTEKLGSELLKDVEALKLSETTRRLRTMNKSIVEISESAATAPTAAATVDSTADIQLVLQQAKQQLSACDQYCHLVEFYLIQKVGGFRASVKLLSILLSLFSNLVAKGFCLPEGFSDELDSGEGATEFCDIEGGELGRERVSKTSVIKLRTRNKYIEGCKNDKKSESQQQETKNEDNAIEMSDDFDGKLEDMEKDEENEDNKSDDDDNDDDHELDKEMGDVGDDDDAEKLDEKMWGGSDDENDEEEEDKNTKEEKGPGAGEQTESELAAKDDSCGENKNSEQDQKTEEQKNDEIDEVDESCLPQAMEIEEPEGTDEGNQQESADQEAGPEETGLDLPDDLNLDSDLDGEGEDQNENMNEELNDGETENPEDSAENENDERKCDDDDKENQNKEDEEIDENENAEGQNEEMKEKEGKEQEQETKDESSDEPKNVPGAEALNETEENEEAEKQAMNQTETMTKHDTVAVQQINEGNDQSSSAEKNKEEEQGVGLSQSEDVEGHEGEDSSSVAASHEGREGKQVQRRPGQSDENRTVGSADESVEKRLKTIDSQTQDDRKQSQQKKSSLYEHIKDAESHYDNQTFDAATESQQQKDMIKNKQEDQETNEDQEVSDDAAMETDEKLEKVESAKAPSQSVTSGDKQKDAEKEGEEDKETVTVSGEKIDTMTVARGTESSIHTVMENYRPTDNEPIDVEKLKAMMESALEAFTHLSSGSPEEEREAQSLWESYEHVTSDLSQDLCEQLRMILEPTQASKLKGDYRTGKRISIRKIIPYIASQFRKDKIWLRRTKPSKRTYQVMVAMDDSLSMDFHHSKQMAFESLAVIANALTKLEVGELSVCSFGDSVKVIHPLSDTFTSQSGASIIKQFTFNQSRTNMIQMLRTVTSIMSSARGQQRGSLGHPETSQLLIIISDGRIQEELGTVSNAIRAAQHEHIFTIFIVLDNPENKNSILDIRQPKFLSSGQIEFQSYMDVFPFPFYIVLRDVQSLPHSISDALRQWFELVTASDS